MQCLLLIKQKRPRSPASVHCTLCVHRFGGTASQQACSQTAGCASPILRCVNGVSEFSVSVSYWQGLHCRSQQRCHVHAYLTLIKLHLCTRLQVCMRLKMTEKAMQVRTHLHLKMLQPGGERAGTHGRKGGLSVSRLLRMLLPWSKSFCAVPPSTTSPASPPADVCEHA